MRTWRLVGLMGIGTFSGMAAAGPSRYGNGGVGGGKTAMGDRGSAATMCEAFQLTAARYSQEVALRTPGGAVSLTWGQY